MFKKKTWSRETALVLMGVLIWTIYKENTPLVAVIIFPILSYATVVFGLKRVDDSTKLFQTKPAEPPEAQWRDSQRPGGSREQPDRRTD